MSNYGALIQGPAQFAGVDQGIDFTGKGTVLAMGTAQVIRVQRSGSGWPGEGAVLVYHLLDGPAKGRYVYVAEDFAPDPSLKPGSIVPKGKPLGQATGSGRAPGIEVGWATSAGLPLAPLPPPRPADQHTPQGAEFNNFAQALSGSGGSDVPGLGGPNRAGSITSAVVGAIPGASAVVGAAGDVASVGSFVGRLTDPSYLLRGLQIIAGAMLVLTGIVLLARQVALAADLPDPVNAAGGALARRSQAQQAADSAAQRRPVGERSPKQQRRAGFKPSDSDVRRPRRGAPGSTRLAAGDSIPY